LSDPAGDLPIVCPILHGVLAADSPFGVLLGDESLDPLGQLAVTVLTGIGTGVGQIQVALVLQRLGRRTVGDPLLLELEQVLGALQDDDHRGQAAGHPDRAAHAGDDRQRCGDHQLEQLEPEVTPVVVATVAVVPAELSLEPLPGRVLGGWWRHGLHRPQRSGSVLAACHPPASLCVLLGSSAR
jgi:hypothetical protein